MNRFSAFLILAAAPYVAAVPIEPKESDLENDLAIDTDLIESTLLIPEAQRVELIKAARRFLDAQSPEQRLTTVAPLLQVESRLLAWSQEAGETADWSKAEIGSRFIRKAPFTIVPVRGGGVPSLEIVLIDTPEGPKVDWEAFVTYQQRLWSSLGEGGWSESVEIRAQVTPAPNHHPVYSEAVGYRCFILTHPSSGQRLFAYSKERGEGRAEAVWKGYTQPMVLSVRQPPEMKGTLNVEILNWIAVGWSRYQSE